MAEEIPRGPEPHLEADQHDDVLGKIDQLLNRHRPKLSATEAIPVLSDAPDQEDVPIDDGIPLLTDAVNGPGEPPSPPSASSRSGTISVALILRRMAIVLDAEHARLRGQIGDDDALARKLDRLVAELRRALPAAVRAAITDKTPDPARPRDDGRL
ncbi:MAG: hypothetical protein H7X76_07190 [Prolixibacteraceae bacterium]|nr:hypothetical protein [Burkholderiales bacterium]